MYPLPLDQIVNQARRIIVARIVGVQKASPMVYDVEVTRLWLGRLPTATARFVYHFPVLETRFTDASGHEHEPDVEQIWIFLSRDDEGETVFRVEPVDNEDRILDLLD